jgi:conjugative transfer signal peptidase TraF
VPLPSRRRLIIHRRWPLVVLASCGAIVAVAHALDLRLNATDSAPLGLYRAAHPPRLERGELVVVCLPAQVAALGRERHYLRAGRCPDASEPLLKQVAAVPGDSVRLSANGLAVNGRSLPGTEVRTQDRAGRPLAAALLGEARVGAGELWVLGLRPEVSWDSRYFGPVSVESVEASAVPILTAPWRKSALGANATDPPLASRVRDAE